MMVSFALPGISIVRLATECCQKLSIARNVLQTFDASLLRTRYDGTM
jgi:hypothetical protein